MGRVVALIFALLLSVSCADLISFNKGNIQDALAKPTFIKFFAPWCGHCKSMAADWIDFAKQSTSPQLAIGEVDCTIEGPLCGEFGVSGYPTMLLLRDGKTYEFNRPRQVREFNNFAREFYQLDSVKVKPFPASLATRQAAPAAPAAAVPPPTQQPAAPAAAAGGLVVVTDSTYQQTIGAGGVWLVKLYAPWCGYCKQLAPTWDELAAKAQGFRVAKVDCTVEQKICNAYSVRGYPTIKVIADGKQYDFRGQRTIDAFSAFASSGYKSESGSPVPQI